MSDFEGGGGRIPKEYSRTDPGSSVQRSEEFHSGTGFKSNPGIPGLDLNPVPSRNEIPRNAGHWWPQCVSLCATVVQSKLIWFLNFTSILRKIYTVAFSGRAGGI